MAKLSLQSRSLTVNAAWLTLAKCVAFSATILIPILLVRQMSREEFGIYKQAFLAVNTMITILPLGFAMSAFYFLPREPSRRGQVILNIVAFYLFIGGITALTLIFYPELLAGLFNSPELTRYGREIGIVVLFWMASSFFELAAVAQGETYLAAVVVVGSHLSRAVLLLSAAIWIGTLQALIHAALLHGVLQTGALWLYLRSRFPGFWRRFDWNLMRSQLAYGMPLGAAGLLWILQTDLHNYFVSHKFGPAAYAIYAIGCFQLPLVGIVQEAVGSLMISRVSELRSEGDAGEILSLIARMMRKMAFVLLPIFVFLLVVRHEMIVFLFTEQYLPSAPLFAINLCLIPLSIFSAGYDPVLRAYPESFPFLIALRIILSVFLVAALWIGMGSFGLVGAIGAVVLINLLERLVLGLKVGRILGMSWRDSARFKDVGKLMAAALAAGVVAEGVRRWSADLRPLMILALSWAGFGVSYAIWIFTLGVMTAAEREVLLRKTRSLLPWTERRERRGRMSSSDDVPSPLR